MSNRQRNKRQPIPNPTDKANKAERHDNQHRQNAWGGEQDRRREERRESYREEINDHCDQVASHAAKIAVKEVFYMLGIDVESAREMEQFRETLRLALKLRTAADKMFILVLSFGTLGIGFLAWYAISHYFGTPSANPA